MEPTILITIHIICYFPLTTSSSSFPSHLLLRSKYAEGHCVCSSSEICSLKQGLGGRVYYYSPCIAMKRVIYENTTAPGHPGGQPCYQSLCSTKPSPEWPKEPSGSFYKMESLISINDNIFFSFNFAGEIYGPFPPRTSPRY